MTQPDSSAQPDADPHKAVREHPAARALATELKRKIDQEEAKDADFLKDYVDKLIDGANH